MTPIGNQRFSGAGSQVIGRSVPARRAIVVALPIRMGNRMKRENALLFLLSSAAGSIDALSFIGYGAFTSAMSGNTVLLGIAIGRLRLGPAVYSAVALTGYALGALASTVFGDDRTPRRLRWLLLAEVVLLAGFAAFAFVYPARPSLNAAGAAMIALGGTAMGIQAVAARSVGAPGIPTVVFTSTLTAIVGAIGRRLVSGAQPLRAETWRQIDAFACYGEQRP
jgi:uncharacterized membrane protein YoaK (UPF0700 family)